MQHLKKPTNRRCYEAFRTLMRGEEPAGESGASTALMPTKASFELFNDVMKCNVGEDMAMMRYEKYMPDSQIQLFLQCAARWHGMLGEELCEYFKAVAPPHVLPELCARVHRMCDVFAGLKTAAQRRSFHEFTMPVILFKERFFGMRPVKAKGTTISVANKRMTACDVGVIATVGSPPKFRAPWHCAVFAIGGCGPCSALSTISMAKSLIRLEYL